MSPRQRMCSSIAPQVIRTITRVTGPFCVRGDDSDACRLRAGRDRGLGIRRRRIVTSTGCSKRCAERRAPARRQRVITLASVRPPASRWRFRQRHRSNLTALTPRRDRLWPRKRRGKREGLCMRQRARRTCSYLQLLVIGFAIEPNARALVDKIESRSGIPATYVQATPDLVMGDLLKDDAFEPALLRVRPSRCRGPQGRARGEGRSAALRGRAARPGHFRSDDVRRHPPQRRRRARLVPRHRLERPLLPRLAGVLPAHERVGQPQESARRPTSTSRCGTTSRAPSAHRSPRATHARSQ